MGEKGVIVSLLDMDARPFLHEYLARIGVSAADVAAPFSRSNVNHVQMFMSA